MKTVCPFCKNFQAKPVFKTGKYSLISCTSCDLVYLMPMPTKAQIASLYGEEYFNNEMDHAIGYANYNHMEGVLKKEAAKKIEFIKGATNKKKLLDIGCGLGTFLRVAKSKGFDVCGNDISTYAQKYVKSHLKTEFFLGQLTKISLPKESFDIVTAWDVFEHIPEVNRAFSAVNICLKPGGYLFLTTPNIKSWDSKFFGKHWYGYKKIPEHLIFFSPQSIAKILNANGFKVIKTETWGFERDLNFLTKKASIYLPSIDRILLPLLKLLHLENLSIYLPITDMMVIARKR